MASRFLRSGALALLALGLVALIPGCGDEEVPAPTTPAPAPPTPTPTPTPEPDPPAPPDGLRISNRGADFIEWSWTPVPDVSGYDAQYSTNEAFTDEDEIIARTAEQISYRKTGLAPETSGYLRVRAAVGTDDDRITSEWSTHLTGITTEAAPTRPPAPTNVEVTGQTDTTITWSWEPVAGAVRYQIQHSDRTPIGADAPGGHTSRTTYTVRNLSPSSDRYLRVQADFGTRTEPEYGPWSLTVRGTTTGPTAPARTPLLRLTGLQARELRNTTITLAWVDPNEEDDVDRYEVVQRSADGNWTAATCEAGGVVTDEECVASELTQGTNYQFRVRAHPDSDDDTKSVSPWSLAVSAVTTGRPPVTIEDDGGLNLRWRSEGEDQTAPQITWTWDRGDAGAQQPQIDHYVALLQPTDARDDCPNLSAAPLEAAASVTDEDESYNKWHDLDSRISFTLTVADSDSSDSDGVTGEVRGLCVVRTWEDERKIRQFGEVSVVWGSTVPFSTAGKVQRDNGSTRVTTSIGWDFQRDAGFDYVLRLLSTDAKIGSATSDLADCAGGKSVESPDAVGRQNVKIVHTETSLKPYTHYQLCVRAENDYGASEWTFVGGAPTGGAAAGAATSLPAAPSAPALQTNQSDITTGSDRRKTVNSLYWSVRHKEGTPEDSDHYNIVIFRSAEDSIPRNDQIQTTCDTANGASPGEIEILLASDEKFDLTSGFTRYPLNSAVALEYDPTALPLDSTDDFDQYYFYMCIRADDTPDTAGDGNHGPWTISRTTGFVGGSLLTPGVSGLQVTRVGVPETTPTQARFTATWTANAAATQYEVQYVIGDTDSVSDPDETTTIRSTRATEYEVTQAFPSTANRGNSQTFEGRFRVRYYRTAGGITLRGTWSAVVPSAALPYP